MIEVSNLTKKYGKHTAVDDLSFQVEKGQIYGFLGPNGAGKSTTMNIITGYLAATEGTVKINGHDVLKEPEEAEKCIGYLPELPPLYMDMTVGEYLCFVAELKKVPSKDRVDQIEEIMEKTGVTEMKDRLIKNLSKGYKQRVGLAQALIGYPEVIILDEPSVGLDPKQIIEMREFIRSLANEHTVILSSHILSEVQAVCKRVIIINRGHIIADDTAENLSKNLSDDHSLVARIIGREDDVTAVLNSVKDVKSVSCLGELETGSRDYHIEPDEGCDIRAEVSKRLAERGKVILSLRSNELTLEQIFLRLTGEDDMRRYFEAPVNKAEESDAAEDAAASDDNEDKEEI